ncbi:Phosphatidylethanolamine [Venturia nashicola]|uniref:Phosphatidylethanolamine n=1 Tax=Venturia nashicola TaxID=86259 RepID=A0A4Z1P8R1_9PEZI|nr:Phosphatidylethanolamine [Venturia nashicola]
MRCTNSTFLSLLLLPLTLAAPIDTTPPSDTAAATPNIYEIETNRVIYELTTLSNHLQSMYQSRPSDRTHLSSKITSASARVVSVSRDSAATMRAAPPATFIQENELLGPINRLTLLTRDTEREWLAIRDIVFQMNGQQKVIQLLRDMNQAGAEFAYAMNGKMSGLAKEVGRIYGDAVDGMEKEVIKAYSASKAGNAGGWN